MTYSISTNWGKLNRDENGTPCRADQNYIYLYVTIKHTDEYQAEQIFRVYEHYFDLYEAEYVGRSTCNTDCGNGTHCDYFAFKRVEGWVGSIKEDVRDHCCEVKKMIRFYPDLAAAYCAVDLVGDFSTFEEYVEHLAAQEERAATQEEPKQEVNKMENNTTYKMYTKHENGEAYRTHSAAVAMKWHRAGAAVIVGYHDYTGAVIRTVDIPGAPQEAPQGRDENRDLCRAIAEDLDRYNSGLLHRCPDCGQEIELPDDVGDKYRCPGCGQIHDLDDLEQLGMWDYFQDVYDMDWILDSNREYKACRLMVACGGPNIYINTWDKRVELYWWTESATYPLSYEAIEAIDEWAEECWACCQ